NFRLLPDDVVYMADVTQPSVFLCQTEFPDVASAVKRAHPDTELLWLSGASAMPSRADSVAQLIDGALGASVPNAAVESDSPCWLFFTSGTTGRPKAAVLTHGQMAFVITNHLCDLLPDSTC